MRHLSLSGTLVMSRHYQGVFIELSKWKLEKRKWKKELEIRKKELEIRKRN